MTARGLGCGSAGFRLTDQGMPAYQLLSAIEAHRATIDETLVHGICEANPPTETRRRRLTRWLQDRLRRGDP